MAPISPGKPIGPPRKAREQTQTTKSYRYEPFTKRVAKLKIDPVHKVQQSRLKEARENLSQSRFRSSLEEWSELNLTTTFTSFFNHVNQLCESLPQLLHHADRVVQILLEHIEKQEPLALEPLLSLVAHLAHDLGQEFAKYFPHTVTLVAQVATTQEDPAVIEACFSCLAWMYKYLSRLLVQDLRPLLDIVLPYFSNRKEYIRRFTAESVAFLIRKAATQYHKNQDPLKKAINYLLDTKCAQVNEKEVDSFADTCMNLIAESASGVDAGLHSSAPELYNCVLSQVATANLNTLAVRILRGITVNLIHRTDAAGFQRISNIIIEQVQKPGHLQCEQEVVSHLFLITTATRGGTRIENWAHIFSALEAKLIEGAASSSSTQLTISNYVKAASATFQNAPLDQLLPFSARIIQAIINNAAPFEFFSFCDTVARLSRSRFQDLVLPHLQQFIVSKWSGNQTGIVVLSHDLSDLGCITRTTGTKGYMAISDSWEQGIRQSWHNQPLDLGSSYGQLLLARAIHFPKKAQAANEFAVLLRQSLLTALSSDNARSYETRIFLGWGLQTLLELCDQETHEMVELHQPLLSAPSEAFELLPFVQALSHLTQRIKQSQRTPSIPETVLPTLIRNLLNPSVDLRKASAQLIEAIVVDADSPSSIHDAIQLMYEILDTPYSITDARKLGMLIRRLPQAHQSMTNHVALATTIPSFAMGLLQDYHDKLRVEVASMLSQMITDSKTEDFVLEIVKDWLQAPFTPPAAQTNSGESLPSHVSPFECTRLNFVHSAFNTSREQFVDPAATIQNIVLSAHSLLTTRTPPESRTIALELLQKIPQVAEKRSKLFVPAFLAAQKGRVGYDSFEHDESNSVNTVSPDIEERGWTIRERRLFLQLLAQFNNPRVLYRADNVHTTLFDLLSNGDPEIRKLAFSALLKWKDKSLTAKQELLIRVAEAKPTTSDLGSMLLSEVDSGPSPEFQDQVLPVLMRLIFGQLVGRVGVHGSQEAKRKSILRLVFRMQRSQIFVFLDVVLGRLREVDVADNNPSAHELFSQDLISLDQQYGFLRMVAAMLEILQLQFAPFGTRIINAVLYCAARASTFINNLEDKKSAPELRRQIRRAGIQCLNMMLEYCPELELAPYKQLLWSYVIGPRLPAFVEENSQGVSALLKMFSLCARSHARLDILMHKDQDVFGPCWNLLGNVNSKPAVKLFILEEIIHPMLSLTDEVAEGFKQACTAIPHMNCLLDNTAILLQQSPSKELLHSTSAVLQHLVGLGGDTQTKKKIIELLVTLLSEPSRRMPPHIQSQVLKTIESLLNETTFAEDVSLRRLILDLVARYFDYFRDLPNRRTCARLLKKISRHDETLAEVAELCEKLTAPSAASLGDVDYEAQSAAFASIHRLLDTPQLPPDLAPILHSLIFLIRTTDDQATRSNALSCLKHLIKVIAHDHDRTAEILNPLLLAIQKHLKDDSETVRADFVELLGTAVQHCKGDKSLQEMEILSVGNDDEASFFTNILHIQQHRRTRAMRRLINEVESGRLSADNISMYFLPLFQKFATDDVVGDVAHASKGQSIASMVTLLQWLDWKAFRTVARQYRQALNQKSREDKLDVRLLNQAADALSAAMKQGSEVVDGQPKSHLSASLPNYDVVAEELKTNFIPKLTELSHYKDEGEVSERLPAATVAIKLIKLLSGPEISLLATPLILDMAQVLRSRTQETRDLARNKVAEAVSLLGPSSMQFVVKELRTALTRGYQLHVLGYTVHTILLATADQRALGDLDYCVEDLVKVVLDDIFGTAGQEKDNQEYSSTMKEVKSSKSFDSMEMLARSTTVKNLPKLIMPFEMLLSGSLTSRQMRHVDELLRRIGVGISHSPAASSQDLLIFAYELIQSFYRAQPSQPLQQLTNDEKARDRYIVQKDSVARVGTVKSSSQLYKIAKFAIDIARSTFTRHSELMIPENVHGFLPIIGDALVEAQEDVKISALRLLSAVVKLRMPHVSENAMLYVMEAVKVVKGAVNTNDEAAQAALKLVAAIIREMSEVQVRESDIAYLLKRTMPDLEEPDKQGITFNFVKAVMARRMQIPEIYELADKIGQMLVTSQSRASRDAARGVYVHFLLDYPQGKTRWAKQIKFLVNNLEFKYPEGRQNTMEAVSTLLMKVDDRTGAEIASVMFLPIVLRMANDDNEHCREMAGALLSQIFEKVPVTDAPSLLDPLRSWLEQDENMLLKRISLQAWTIYFKALGDKATEEHAFVRDKLAPLLNSPVDDENPWETNYYALELTQVLVEKFPQVMLSAKHVAIWKAIIASVERPHPWLQISSSKLIGILFRECAISGNTTLPLSCPQGFELDEDSAISLLRSSLRALRTSGAGKVLAKSVLPNVLFLARCADSSGTKLAIKNQQDIVEGEMEGGSSSEQEEVMNGDHAALSGESSTFISVTQYVLDQATRTLRREPSKQTSASLQPKLLLAMLLQSLLPHVTVQSVAAASDSIVALLIPLLHMTSTTTPTPRSQDSEFSSTYSNLIEQCHVLLENIQAKLGDKEYARLVTSATRQAREKRQARRSKRAIENIAEPERAAKEKRRKFEKKKERRKEIKSIHRSNRRKNLGF